MTHGAQEPLKILLIDIVVVPIIHSFEGGTDTEVIAGLQGSLDVLCFQMQLDLGVEQLAQCPLHSHWQKLVCIELHIWPLSGSRAQEGVIAGQQHLQKVMVVQFEITI